MNIPRKFLIATALATIQLLEGIAPAGGKDSAEKADSPARSVEPNAEPVGALLFESTTYHDLERRYTNRDISARDFQKAIERLERRANSAQRLGRGPAAVPPPEAFHPLVVSPTPPPPLAQPAPPAVQPVPPTNQLPAPPPAESTQKAPATVTKTPDVLPAKPSDAPAAPASAVPAPKLSKRERLDALLKLVVDGKMTDEEYKQRRLAIALEPD